MSEFPFPSQDGFFNPSSMGLSDGNLDLLSTPWGSQFDVDVDVDVASLFAPEPKYAPQQNYQGVAPSNLYTQPASHQKSWESMKMGEIPDLSQWDLAGVSQPEDDTNDTTASSRNNSTSQSSTPKSTETQGESPQNSSEIKSPRKRGRKKKAPKSPEEQEIARKRFLERNRQAASKCREKKKKWTDELEERRLLGQKENARLQEEKDALMRNVATLRRMVMSHANCPDHGQHGLQALLNDIKTFGPDMPRTFSGGFAFTGSAERDVKTDMKNDASVHDGLPRFDGNEGI